VDEGYRDVLERLAKAAVLHEHQFTSRVPLVGALIARFRRTWNSVSTRWYVAPALHQQSQVNELTVELLTRLSEQVERQQREVTELREKLTLLQGWLVSQDRDESAIRHDLGELTTLVGAVVRSAGLEPGIERLAELDSTGPQE
jgi:hypothetical protein